MKANKGWVFDDRMFFIIIICILGISIIFNIIYTYATKFKKVITVDEKYTYGSSNKKGSQSISDTENNVYILKDNFWLFHFTSVEVFNKLDVKSTYEIEGYGLRIPFLGYFPNIYKAKKIS
jgi:hypothetical protein